VNSSGHEIYFSISFTSIADDAAEEIDVSPLEISLNAVLREANVWHFTMHRNRQTQSLQNTQFTRSQNPGAFGNSRNLTKIDGISTSSNA